MQNKTRLKKCALCGATLPVEEFDPSTKSKSGFKNFCRACSSCSVSMAKVSLELDQETDFWNINDTALYCG